MFDALTARLTGVLDRIRGGGVLTEENVAEALREVRRALLEADVHVRVARTFIEDVKDRTLGERTLKGVRPGAQLVRAVHEGLVALLGGPEPAPEPDLSTGGRRRLLLLGLQGCGKTTLAAKLARRYGEQGWRIGLLGLDAHRPAAGDQLRRLAEEVAAPVRVVTAGGDPRAEGPRLMAALESEEVDAVVVDTAGRQTVDENLMTELAALHEALRPTESWLVLDAMTGQDAVRTAEAFTARLPCTGAVLTKLDGDARGGAALSLRSITGLPIRYVGVGESVGALEVFQPERLAGRILGMGDVVTLVERAAEQAGGMDQLAADGKKLAGGRFDLEDLRDQLKRLRGLGSMHQVLDLLPGSLTRGMPEAGEGEIPVRRMTAILDSMTPEERRRPQIIDGSRRRRIARGSGTSVREVNDLLRQYESMHKMMKALKGRGKGRLPFPLG